MTADVVVCGAGIAGVSTGYFLAVAHGLDVVVCDPRAPLTLTSDKSTECYRNWWPNPAMVTFMDRSIDLLDRFAEESGDAFHLNRRGYVYLSAGTLEPDGAIAITQPELARSYPYLTDAARSAVRVERAGWFSAVQLGGWLLDRSRRHGLTLLRAAVVAIDDGEVSLDDGTRIRTDVFVNAAGPLLRDVGDLVGADLPVFSEVHQKVAFRDTLKAIPRDAPMLIWSDPQDLDLTDEERTLCREQGRTDLLEELPAGCHCRPEGGADSEWVLALWEYHRDIRRPEWPLPIDELYPETVLRGLTTMIPALAGYRGNPPESVVDGGYYTKTTDNLPLIGPAGSDGSFVCGALSGYGVMAACAAGELAALHVAGGTIPAYGDAFHPARYDDPAYVEAAAAPTDTGQI